MRIVKVSNREESVLFDNGGFELYDFVLKRDEENLGDYAGERLSVSDLKKLIKESGPVSLPGDEIRRILFDVEGEGSESLSVYMDASEAINLVFSEVCNSLDDKIEVILE